MTLDQAIFIRLQQLCAELIAARRERDKLVSAIFQTLEENGHLADGDVCTLKVLKDAVSKYNVQR